jgi:acetoin utilization deacetylase AcuC-like enzyme
LYHPAIRPKLKLFYCDQHRFPLPPGHKFPLTKYRLLRERLAADGTFDLQASPLAEREQVLRVHAAGYTDRFFEGTLEPGGMRRIGFPW